jgi:hypothetical protein
MMLPTIVFPFFRQPNTQKNRKYNYKKRQTMVGNLMHRKTENTIIKKDKQWLAT